MWTFLSTWLFLYISIVSTSYPCVSILTLFSEFYFDSFNFIWFQFKLYLTAIYVQNFSCLFFQHIADHCTFYRTWEGQCSLTASVVAFIQTNDHCIAVFCFLNSLDHNILFICLNEGIACRKVSAFVFFHCCLIWIIQYICLGNCISFSPSTFVRCNGQVKLWCSLSASGFGYTADFSMVSPISPLWISHPYLQSLSTLIP